MKNSTLLCTIKVGIMLFSLLVGSCKSSPPPQQQATPAVSEQQQKQQEQQQETLSSSPTTQSASTPASASSLPITTPVEQFPQVKSQQSSIQLLYFSSWEGTLLPIFRQGRKVGGLAHLAALVKKLRQPQSLLLCAGNFLPGDTTGRKPVIEALNLLGLSISSLGNLELNYGPEQLKEKLQQANFQVLSTNVYYQDRRLFPAYALNTLGDFQIATIGVTSQEAATQVNPEVRDNLIFRDPLFEIGRVLEDVAKQADIVVVLSDLSLEEDRKLAERYGQEVDLILSRYDVNPSHQYQVVGSVPIVRTPQKNGTQLGEIILTLADNNLIISKPKFYEVGPESREVRGLATPGAVAELLDSWQEHEKIRQEVIGVTEVTLVGEYQKIRQQETRLGNLVADILLAFRPSAQIALVNSGGIRASIPKGKIRYGMIIDALPYKNQVVELEISGATLKEVLENSVARYESVSGAFLQVGGVSFRFSLAKERFNRVSEVRVQGEPLQLRKNYRVVTLDYIAEGGDDYIMLKDKEPLFVSEKNLQQIVRKYILDKQRIHPRVEGRIQILE